MSVGEDEEYKAGILRIRSLNGNSTCADCDADNPNWAVINLGVLICTQCAGVHRNLGTHISKVRSMTIDTLSPEAIERLQTTSNASVNSELEYRVLLTKPNRHSAVALREAFIRAKYEQKAFSRETAKGLDPICATIDEAKDDCENIKNVSMVEFSGVLFVHVLGGKNLKSADINGLSDPFVEISNGVQTVKTNRVNKNLNPFFDEMLTINVKGLSSILKLRVYDHDFIGKNDLLGSADIDLRELDRRKTAEFVYKKINLDSQGYIGLALKFEDLS